MSEPTIEDEARSDLAEAVEDTIYLEMGRAIQGLMWYDYNVSKVEQISAIYGDEHHGNYTDEKLDLLNRRGSLWLWGQMDGYHRNRLVKAIYKKYRLQVCEHTPGGDE